MPGYLVTEVLKEIRYNGFPSDDFLSLPLRLFSECMNLEEFQQWIFFLTKGTFLLSLKKQIMAVSTNAPIDVILIDQPDECARVVRKLLDTHAAAPTFTVAVDLEGRGIGPAEGVLAILTVALLDGTVYLFDIAAMKQAAFETGLLKDLLEHPKLVKLFFDCRTDVAELHKYNVRPQGVLDLQPPDVRHVAPRGDFVVGLAKALEKLRLTTARDDAVKSEGKKLFDPEDGGSYDVWFERPLKPALVEYAAIDVKLLFAMRRTLQTSEAWAARVSEQRVAKFCKPGFQRGQHMAIRDF
jgi:exonuclease 3'-5' domain-containing protein 1